MEPIATVSGPDRRRGLSVMCSPMTPTRPATVKADDQDGYNAQAEPGVDPPAGERADGGVGRDGEIGKAQHGEDRRKPDCRHRDQGAGEQAVDDRLGKLRSHQRQTVIASRPSAARQSRAARTCVPPWIAASLRSSQ